MALSSHQSIQLMFVESVLILLMCEHYMVMKKQKHWKGICGLNSPLIHDMFLWVKGSWDVPLKVRTVF